MNIAVSLCAQNISSITVDSPLLHAFKPDFFGRLVSSSEIEKCHSCHVSILIAKYFSLHNLDEALLCKLLANSNLTNMDPQSAMDLLEVMESLTSKELFEDFRQRCTDVIIENWSDIRDSNREELFRILGTIENKRLAKIFDAVEAEYYQQHYTTMTLQCKLVKRYRSQLAEARQKREEEISILQVEMDSRVAELMERQQELESQLKEHTAASNRRAVRSSGAFRSRTPTKSTEGSLSEAKSSSVRQSPALRERQGGDYVSKIPQPSPSRFQQTSGSSQGFFGLFGYGEGKSVAVKPCGDLLANHPLAFDKKTPK